MNLIPYEPVMLRITYHMPDHPHVLQEFVWQFLDFAPVYPRMNHFVNYWRNNIEGPIHTIEFDCGTEETTTRQ